jgi:EAL domain-containing protein (putative c-di-GMP-specific phosphodiesterase class I)
VKVLLVNDYATATGGAEHMSLALRAGLRAPLGLRTIAEFVESEAILDRLRDFGVDFAQGYHVGKPAPVEELAPVML